MKQAMKASGGINRKLTMLWRVVIAGFNNFVRNAWLSIAAMAVMVITLTIVLFSFIANATFNYTVQTIRDKIVISVYLKDEVTTDQRNKLISQLDAIDNVRDTEYVSKDDALAGYVIDNKDDIDLQLAISALDNPLPASLKVRMHDPDQIDPIRSFLEKPDVKALQSGETSYSGERKEAIDKIAKATTLIRQAGIGGVIIFAFVSVLIIFNTIQMAIFNRRDELAIMRLLGASKWYIRSPFLVESLLIGFSAAVISIVFCNTVFSVASGTLNANTLGILDITYADRYFRDHFWMIVGIQLGIGMLIGMGSSFVATQRYLRFKVSK